MSSEGPGNIESIRPKKDQAERMYDSLPEEMKTGYFGLVPEGLSKRRGDAQLDAVPYVVVKFKFGGEMALHVSHPNKAGASYEEQAQKLIDAGRKGEHIESVELFWK